MAKLLVQARGSMKDPAFRDQVVDGGGVGRIPFNDYFIEAGIGVLEKDLIRSVHGCSELTLHSARQIQEFADQGNRVAVIAAGGLLWALPSYFAANMPTVFSVGVPTQDGWYGGLGAFLAPHVPSGVAAVGGVGVGRYDTAARVVRCVLNSEFEGVYTYDPSEKLVATLKALEVPILGEAPDSASELQHGLVVGSLDEIDAIESFDEFGSVGIFTPPKSSDPGNVLLLMTATETMRKSVWARGDENVAYLAAKAVAPYNGEVSDALRRAAVRKVISYDATSLHLESFVGVQGEDGRES